MLNEPLIRKVVDYIEEHPREWEQDHWGVTRYNHPPKYAPMIFDDHLVDGPVEADSWQKCRTTACFAGTALLIADAPITSACISDSARDLLGLSNKQAQDIFYWYGDADLQDPKDKVAALKQQITKATGLTFDDFE